MHQINQIAMEKESIINIFRGLLEFEGPVPLHCWLPLTDYKAHISKYAKIIF